MTDDTQAPIATKLVLPTSDGTDVVAFCRTPPAPAATIIFSPALGVHAGFYDRLANLLVAQGIEVIQHEQRGHGDSPVRAGKGTDWGYHELVACEVATLAAYATRTAPERPLFVGGHSLGAQLACLYAATADLNLAGIVVIASGVQHHSLYRRSWQARVLIGLTLFPRVARWRGFHDGARMGFGGREPVRLITDWARVARTGRYEPAGTTVDYEARMRDVTLPLLQLTFTRDDFAPRRSARKLAAKMPNARLTSLEWGEAELGGIKADHFAWARRPDPVAALVAGWLKITAAHGAMPSLPG